MHDDQIRHLPVLDDGAIAGIISIRDLLAVLVDHECTPESAEIG